VDSHAGIAWEGSENAQGKHAKSLPGKQKKEAGIEGGRYPPAAYWRLVESTGGG
jgi:hypothetical protein